jgi:hypothetical protein
MEQTRLAESDAYQARREELRLAEIWHLPGLTPGGRGGCCACLDHGPGAR